MRRPFKVYYDFDTQGVVETQFCCKTMKDYWNMDMIFFNGEESQVIDKNGINYRYCPKCGAKVIVKESRL